MTAADDNRVLLALRLPGDAAPLEPGQPLSIKGGGRLLLVGRLTHRAEAGETYDIRVEGPAGDWTTVFPSTVRLEPAHSAESAAEVEVLIEPPAGAGLEGTTATVVVMATGRETGRRGQAPPLALAVVPAEQLEVTLVPETERAALLGEYTVTVHNPTGSPVEAFLSTSGDGVHFEIERTRVQLPPGGRAWSRLGVRPTDRLVVGKSASRLFEVGYLARDSELRPRATRGTLVQTPVVPSWLIAAIALAALIVGLVLAFAVPKKTTVPDLTGTSSLLEAESMLRDADLAVGQRFGRAPSGIPTGTILAQVPRAGERVDKDTTVSIVVAVDEVEAIVPSVVGLTFSEADGAVRAVGLVLGLPEGAPADPATALVATQLPAAGGTTPPGSTVNVFFASVAAPSPPAGAVIVPSVLGLPFASAADALRVAGLVATLPSGMPADPAAPVTTQLPAAGEEVAESSTVDLFFESTPEPSPSPAPPVPAEPPTAPAPAPAPPPDGSTGAPDLLSPTLDALVPQELRSACTSLSDAPELSSGGVFCRADDDVEIWYFEFASHTDADGHYEQRVASAGAVRDRGTCGVDPTAESDATLLGNPVPGRLLCAPDDEGRPVIVFGDAELDAVVEARWSSDRPQAELLSWWLEGHALAPR